MWFFRRKRKPKPFQNVVKIGDYYLDVPRLSRIAKSEWNINLPISVTPYGYYNADRKFHRMKYPVNGTMSGALVFYEEDEAIYPSASIGVRPRKSYTDILKTITHELVHCSQFEKLLNDSDYKDAFDVINKWQPLRAKDEGYWESPMEKEAYDRANKEWHLLIDCLS